MKKLRLLLFPECNRSCPGCCNQDWDLESLPYPESFSEYSKIFLTGGEPMLEPDLIRWVVAEIRATSDAKVILYTAMPGRELADICKILDGVTVTLHGPDDKAPFEWFAPLVYGLPLSKRLNVFSGVDTPEAPGWQIKNGITWIKNCPLPKDEVFCKLH